MHRTATAFAAALFIATTCAARAQWAPSTVNLRYNEQISNGSAGSCGCFGLEGFAADAGWKFNAVSFGRHAGLGVAADLSVVHTGNEGDAPYGLTLSTLTAGPRFYLPGNRRLRSFAQVLVGFAHGSDSAFPQGNILDGSANSFALDIGGAADYDLHNRFSVRILQLDYLRTGLPNGNTNWQSNLRIGVGLTLRLQNTAKH